MQGSVYLEFVFKGASELARFVVRLTKLADDLLGNVGVRRVLKVRVLSPECVNALLR